jgi:hypothetical protein
VLSILILIINYYLPNRFATIFFGILSNTGLRLDFRCIINQKSLKLQTFREQKVANIVSSYRDVIKSDGLTALDSQLNSLQMSVH